MRPADVRRWLEARLFRPFRLYLTNGIAFEIRHPTQATVTGSTVQIDILPPGGQPGSQPGYAVEVSLVHITHLEPITISLSPSSN
jgi:hypothetical protein